MPWKRLGFNRSSLEKSPPNSDCSVYPRRMERPAASGGIPGGQVAFLTKQMQDAFLFPGGRRSSLRCRAERRGKVAAVSLRLVGRARHSPRPAPASPGVTGDGAEITQSGKDGDRGGQGMERSRGLGRNQVKGAFRTHMAVARSPPRSHGAQPHDRGHAAPPQPASSTSCVNESSWAGMKARRGATDLAQRSA